MHIAIDDTYGPEIATPSRYVTGERRTHIAVIFQDKTVEYFREEINGCLEEMRKLISDKASEFHFVDIYNRKPPWNKMPPEANLKLFDFFACMYRYYRWPVIIQTVDSRTFRDHGIEKIVGKIEDLDLSNDADLSLLWLLIKLKLSFKQSPEQIFLFLDEGRRKAGTLFGSRIFHDWPRPFMGSYVSSAAEPLLQIADFIAFCINRSTHLAMKTNRTDIDKWFLNLVGEMEINSKDLRLVDAPSDFSVADFDAEHDADRAEKRLPKL